MTATTPSQISFKIFNIIFINPLKVMPTKTGLCYGLVECPFTGQENRIFENSPQMTGSMTEPVICHKLSKIAFSWPLIGHSISGY
jgi:hypothetical protein